MKNIISLIIVSLFIVACSSSKNTKCKMSFVTKKILLLFFWVMCFNSFAQNEFHTYTKNDGLTSSNILSIKIDYKGIIWAATNSGVNAFTGESWMPVKSISDNNGHNKNLGRVISMFEAINGDLWIVTEKGLFLFNGSYWTFFNDRNNDGFQITDIFEDRRGWIWIMLEKSGSLKEISDIGFSFIDGKIQMYNGERWYKFTDDIGGSAAILIGDPLEYFTSHIQDGQGNIWVTSLDGLYKFDSIKWVKYNEEHLPSDMCCEVVETTDKEIWVATRYGIAKQADDEWIKYEKNRGIKGNFINDLFQDKARRIWAITSKDNRFKSLCVYENDKWKPFFKDNVKIKGSINRLVDFEDQLIAFSKKGLSSFDGENWTNLISKYEIVDDNFTNLVIAKNRTLWFAAENGIYNLNNDGIRLVYSPENNWKVTTVFESYTGGIWVGTKKNGVYMINGEKNKHYTIDNGLNDNYIKEVFEDKKKNIWVVTNGGISRFELPDKSLSRHKKIVNSHILRIDKISEF